MSVTSPLPQRPAPYQASDFTHLVVIEPLGLLYGSAGKFLSPENLVGRSGDFFPPSSMTLAGLFAQTLEESKKTDELRQLQVAGPFWTWKQEIQDQGAEQNFYVPAPLNCLAKNNQIQHYLVWRQGKWRTWGIPNGAQEPDWIIPPDDKYQSGGWLSLKDWDKLQPQTGNVSLHSAPWEYLPHLHPKLKDSERHSVEKDGLFLENSVQLNPDACLVYLSNTDISPGWYRFGGEGHLVNVRCLPLTPTLAERLSQPLGQCFALITPAVWGSNRFSYRAPSQKQSDLYWGERRVTALLAQRPQAIRHRFGRFTDDSGGSVLSRGRYGVPAGAVYVLDSPLSTTWREQSALFPVEGVSFQRWGCGLALPLPDAQN
ncbi:MAG: type III-B CRISPR module-associated Cmr3 family protein [Cyanobacteriota bacterium]|jgi:CRISPR-associated protein Cmr3